MSIGSSCLSRSICLTCLAVSPSMRPLRSRPCASSAVYSNAPIRPPGPLVFAGNAQHFFQRRFARHDLAPAVIANTGARGARIALQILLRGSIVNHGAHVIVDGDELINARAPTIAVARIAARPVQLHGGAALIEIQQP